MLPIFIFWKRKQLGNRNTKWNAQQKPRVQRQEARSLPSPERKHRQNMRNVFGRQVSVFCRQSLRCGSWALFYDWCVWRHWGEWIQARDVLQKEDLIECPYCTIEVRSADQLVILCSKHAALLPWYVSGWWCLGRFRTWRIARVFTVFSLSFLL